MSLLRSGEDADSYGYGGTGRFSDNCKFRLYGETYGMGDVMLAIVDFTARPPTISYCKNGHFLGVAARLSRHPPGQALFPHVLSKNCRLVNRRGAELNKAEGLGLTATAAN